MADTVPCRYCDAPVVMAINSRNRREPVVMAQGGDLILLPSRPEVAGGVVGPRIASIANLRDGVEVRTLRYQRHTCPRGRA